jgi:alpha-glucosidase (family GH31 glycosyl hydrolase)
MVDKWGEGNFFTFTRSAVDRARSKVAIWNGDPQATFEGLRYSVASGIRAGLLLFSTWGSDIGGYLRSEANPSEELWARWMQFGAFSPMYEIMVGTGHTPWYAPYSSRLVSILQTTAAWHTRLLPYIRASTWHATQTGIPVIRALFLEYPGDDLAYTISDQYAFGDAFLVAPILSEGGSRTVYFPKGAKFLDYLEKTTVYAGGSSTVAIMPLEKMPVYVREGAIVVAGDIHRGNAKWIDNYSPSLEIEFFPSYNVSTTRFEFLRADTRVSVISTTTDRNASTVTVKYDDVGVNGTLHIYSKGGVINIPMPAGGSSMTVTLDRFASLFD